MGPSYRKVMFGLGEETSERHGLTREAIAKVWAEGGKLSLQQLLRCKLRYLSDGIAIGGEGFIEGIFRARRSLFSAGRESGARRMRGGDWGGLWTLRALSRDPVEPPPG